MSEPLITEEMLKDMEARKDAAYEERNKVVAALAKLFPSGIARTNIPGWSEDWHGCVYIDLPTGQVSWHYHDSQAWLFDDLPPYQGKWDGHDTPEKYRRLAALGFFWLPAEMEKELGRAYRALRGMYGMIAKGQMPDETMLAYHSPTIGAAVRFVHEGALDGSQYFVGKPVKVLHDALATGRGEHPNDPGRIVPHHGSGPDDQ